MRFLIDAQLPPALARLLRDLGHAADHVMDVGLLAASDEDLWKHALATQAVIITKDEDFVTLHRRNEAGVSIVWIRLGNSSRTKLVLWFMPMLPRIIQLLESGETLIEVR